MEKFFKAISNGEEVLEMGDSPAGSHQDLAQDQSKNKQKRAINRGDESVSELTDTFTQWMTSPNLEMHPAWLARRRRTFDKKSDLIVDGKTITQHRKAVYAAIGAGALIPGTFTLKPSAINEQLAEFNGLTGCHMGCHLAYYPHAVTGTCYLAGIKSEYWPLAFLLLGVFPKHDKYTNTVFRCLARLGALIPIRFKCDGTDHSLVHVRSARSKMTLVNIPAHKTIGHELVELVRWTQLEPGDHGYCTTPETCAFRLILTFIANTWQNAIVVYVIVRIALSLRVFADGECYRYITPSVRLGKNPFLAAYLNQSKGAAFGCDRLDLEYDQHLDRIHVTPNHHGLPASVVHECLRRNIIVTDDGVYGPTSLTRIGGRAPTFLLASFMSFVMHMAAYAYVYLKTRETFDDRGGRCYRSFVLPDMGADPQLASIAALSEAYIKDCNIRVERFGSSFHAYIDDSGFSARSFHKALRMGFVSYIEGEEPTVCELTNSMTIGRAAFDTPFVTRSAVTFDVGDDETLPLLVIVCVAIAVSNLLIRVARALDRWWVATSFLLSLLFRRQGVTLVLAMMNVYIALQPRRARPVIHMNVFGSAGDKRPLSMYANWLRTRGFVVNWIDHSPGTIGRFMLQQIESSDYSSAAGLTAMLYVRLIEQSLTGGIVLSPLKASFTGAVEYTVSPSPDKVVQFRLFAPGWLNWLNDCADQIYRASDAPIRIDSSRGNCPRSADGIVPLTVRPNRGDRKRLIVMGSGSGPEPDLPLEGTWSTNPASRYAYEPDRDHAKVFATYEEIHCHGGAGTVATAKACGCRVFSYSRLLDREIVSDADYHFSSDLSTFLVQLASGLSPRDLRELWPLFIVSWRNLPALLWIRLRKTWQEMVVVGTTFGLLTFRTLETAARERSLNGIVLNLINGTAVPHVLSIFLTHYCVMMGKAKLKRDGWLQTAKRAWHPANEFLWFIVENNNSLIFTSLVSSYGLLTTYALHAVGGTMVRLILAFLPDLTELVFRWIDAILERYYKELRRDDVIQLRFQRLKAWWAFFLPLYHVEWFNPRTKESLGISVVKQHCKLYQAVNAPVPIQFVLPTSISISKWDDIKRSLQAYEGTLYHPANNCQTTTLAVLQNYGQDPHLRAWLLFLCTVTCVVMSLLGVTVMQLGTVLVALGFTASYIDAMMPKIAFAALGQLEIHSLTDLFNFLVSPSALLVDGPRVIDRWEKYPKQPPSLRQMNPTSLRTIRLNVGGQGKDYLPPLKGMNRPNYTYGRGSCYKLVHNITQTGAQTRVTTDQMELLRQTQEQAKSLGLFGLIAVIATTKERPIDKFVWDWATKECDEIVVLTNTPLGLGCHEIVLPTSGRTLATLRLAMPALPDVRWLSLNATLQAPAVYSLEKLSLLMPFLRKSKQIIGVSAHGLNPGPASGLVYSAPIMGDQSIDFDIYGCEEWELTKHEMVVYVADTMIMLNCVRGQMDFPCKRRMVLYNANTMEDTVEFTLDHWCARTIVTGLAAATPCSRSVGLGATGVVVNTIPVNMAPVVSEMYPQGTRVEDVVTDITTNVGAFVHRMTSATIDLLAEAKRTPIGASVIRSYYQVLQAFSRSGRAPKGVWAPVQVELDKRRAESAGMALHPNPVFVYANFDDTLSHYVKHLNGSHPTERLSVTEFRRRVNRNPYVDTYLRDKMADAHERGIDASVLASRQLMLASLARYNKHGFTDALTDDDVNRLVEAIYSRNPDMFDESIVSDPYKLTKKFLSYKRYSAGLPFTYKGGLTKRSDLRRAGWLKPMAELAKLSYEKGVWYPAIAHAFPKSQVVSADKIKKKPWKMRSIVATAGFNNVQQGILNFDINNRHDFLGTHEKVAMPLNGSYLSYVYADCARYKNVYSLDASDMDANISDGVFRVIAGLRKKGYENHPAYEAICKHIDCAIEQTKHSYVVNLIADDACDLEEIPPEFESVNEWAKKFDESGFVNSVHAPGRVLAKKFGGSTGDSNVTFNNTKAMPIILMYAYSKARGIDFCQFFDEVALHNFGDDDVLATDTTPDVIERAVQIAKQDLGITLTYESKGTNIFDQVFLGRRPVDPELFSDDFELAGVRPPQFAIINDAETMEMRLASEKAEMTRHKGVRHEIYRLEKCMGYALLSAHNRPLYDKVVEYFDEVLTRLPATMVNQAWFKRKYKMIAYKDVIKKWYAPMNPDHFNGVHGLQLKVGMWAQTEAGFMMICRFLNWTCDLFPSHLVQPEGSVNAVRVSDLHIGIFEAHAWHTFVAEFGQAPTVSELEARVRLSPFAQFTNSKFWHETHGAALPTSGPQFEMNANHAMMKVLVYTAVYVHTNSLAGLLGMVPLGNVIADVLNLCLFKSRRLFGTLGYAHYVAKGRGSPHIDALVPKDPYAYHKRAAAIAMTCLPDMHFLAWIPTRSLANAVSAVLSHVAASSNLILTSDDKLANIPALKPWHDAVSEALKAPTTPLLVAPTGTGKTRYTPGVLLNHPDITQVIVVMPRNIICESWSATSGAVFKRKGVTKVSPLMTCTYGYLAHCVAGENTWWDASVYFIFDEAHEESLEWMYLRRVFVPSVQCMALTATPDAQTCHEFHRIDVDIESSHKIEVVNMGEGSLEAAMEIYLPSAKRFLVIEPSLKKCRKIAERLTATGYPVKVVHSGDRCIPPGVHIVATSVIEASITIPGCDLVIDTGDRIVNDAGAIKRVPNTIPGSIQRKGRTGRTNDGVYVQVTPPKNVEYTPVPEVTMVLQEHPIAGVVRVKNGLRRAPKDRQLADNKYAWISGKVPASVESVSLLHKLLLQNLPNSKVRLVYEQLRSGCSVDQFDHFITDDLPYRNLTPVNEAFEMLAEARVLYYVGHKPAGTTVTIKNGMVVASGETTEPEGGVQDRQLDTVVPTRLKPRHRRR